MISVSAELLERLNKEFFDLQEQRQQGGAAQYGELAFLKNPLPQFIIEEVVDLANYARFLYIRLRLLEIAANESGIDLTAGVVGDVQLIDKLPFGPSSFTPTENV
jgi:hypothetical protein